MAKSKSRFFDPRDFFPYFNALDDDKSVPRFPTNFEELTSEQIKAANPAYWMHMGLAFANSSVAAPWMWYGMMLGTMEAMRDSSKSSKKIEKRHKEAVKAVRKFTKHVAGADAVKPPKEMKAKVKKSAKAAKKQAEAMIESGQAMQDATLGFASGLTEILTEPVGGKADDLKWISGVGPKLEETLNGLGIYHFDQIAKWNNKEIDWVDEYLKFTGRIQRDNWIEQSKVLANGGWDEYVKVFGKEPR